jgi:aspartyl-tRNA(Asn)/glutamyl-tRNA(Gln) amidotransferase subunit A
MKTNNLKGIPLLNKSLKDLSDSLHSKEISSVELTQFYLDRIHQYDDSLNSFITVCDESALAAAKQADELLASGNASPLTGIPIAHKDIFCTKDIKTSCASKMLDNFIAPYDATVIKQCHEHGLVTLGKTNMDEFAMGSTNESSFYGPCHNPWDLTHTPGGSSGGSAAAVAARLAPMATGTDTGGSIRQPASMCGITGLKPTYGLVSRFGMIAFASSLDQGGPMAASAQDCAMLLDVMAGHDAMDSTNVHHPKQDYCKDLPKDIKGMRFGIVESCMEHDKLDPAIKSALEDAIKIIESLGGIITTIELPNQHLSVPCYYIIAPAEASSNLARYDGVRYGYRCDNPQSLKDMYVRTRSEGFGEEVKRRILAGTYVLSAGYYDAYYIKAQKIRQLIRQDYINAFEHVDVILSPVSPNTAFGIGEKTNDPISLYLSDIYTIGTNMAGLPGLSVPAGFAGGMPVGLQMTGNYFDEATLLRVGHQFQQATDWHLRVPDAFTKAKGD